MKVINWSFGAALTIVLVYIVWRTFVAFQMMGFAAFVFGFMMSVVWLGVLGTLFVIVSLIARLFSKR